MNDSVYNSTTVSYENPGPGSPNCRPWNLSEMVAPPVSRTRWFHWTLLIGGILAIVFGVAVFFIGVYSHVVEPDTKPMQPGHEEVPQSSGWLAALLGVIVAILGVFLLLIHCRLTNNRFFCHRLSNTRNALRKVITKPRFHNAQTSRGANLLASDPSSFQPTLSTQYDPVPDIGYSQNNGDISEERAKLMAHEAKEGQPVPLDDDDERFEFDEPQDIRNAYKSGRVPGLEWGYIGDLRRTASVHGHSSSGSQQPMSSAAAQLSSSHYKPRHFSGHGYGPRGHAPAPLASMEEITPSLRSSFASVLMYPPSSWGGSDESLPSDFFVNDYENGSLKKQGSFSALSVQSDFQ